MKLLIAERDPGNSGTISPVHLQLLVPVTYRGLCVLCVRTVTKSVVVQGSANHTRSSSAKTSSRALYHKWIIRLQSHERLHCRMRSWYHNYRGITAQYFLTSQQLPCNFATSRQIQFFGAREMPKHFHCSNQRALWTGLQDSCNLWGGADRQGWAPGIQFLRSGRWVLRKTDRIVGVSTSRGPAYDWAGLGSKIMRCH